MQIPCFCQPSLITESCSITLDHMAFFSTLWSSAFLSLEGKGWNLCLDIHIIMSS